MNFKPVEGHANFVADNRSLRRLPFAARLGGKMIRGLKIVDGSIAAEAWLAGIVIAEDLYFVAASQIEAAVGVVRHHVLVMDREIPKLISCHQVGAMLAFVDRILEDAILKNTVN